MYGDLDPGATDRALQHRIQNPRPPKPPAASIWGQAGELIASPFKGVGQAVQETTRVANTVAPVSVGNPLAMTATEQEEILGDSGITREAIDQDLRRGIQSLRPDPLTSTVASQVLQGAVRVVTKAVGYGFVAGPVGAVVGTGLDEAATGTMELMDRGVDRATAAKAGAVRGAVMGASVAMPVVGQTVARTAGLVAVGGPGAFVAEQSLTREILGRAGYADIAAEYDPWDPVGLGLSVAIPGAVGVALHRARITKAAKPGEPLSEARVIDEIAQDPDVVDAALVAHRTQSVVERSLGDMTDPPVAAAHTRALDAAMQALDEGAPVRIADAVVDPAVAARAMADIDARLAAVRAEIETLLPEIAQPAEWRPLELSRTLSDGERQYTIHNRAGDPVGTLHARDRDTNGGPVVQIGTTGIDHPAERGQGTGLAAYRQIIDEALAQGKTVWSDVSVTPDAQRIYQALERRGYKVEKNSGRRPIEQHEDGTLSTNASFVYKVTAGPERAPTSTLATASARAAEKKLMPAVGGYNLDNLLAQAEEALRGGRSVNQALADGGITGELHNALVGFAEFRERLPELAEQFRAIEWNRNGKATVTDMLADAVGRMREGQPPEPVERSLGRAAQIARESPDLPVRMDEAGDARPAAQLVSEARMQARRDKADGKAFSAAIECMLRFGA